MYDCKQKMVEVVVGVIGRAQASTYAEWERVGWRIREEGGEDYVMRPDRGVIVAARVSGFLKKFSGIILTPTYADTLQTPVVPPDYESHLPSLSAWTLQTFLSSY
jgi:hypothetical protein